MNFGSDQLAVLELRTTLYLVLRSTSPLVRSLWPVA